LRRRAMDTVLLLLLIIFLGGLAFSLPTIVRDWHRARSGHK
jgi:hypothetical protein